MSERLASCLAQEILWMLRCADAFSSRMLFYGIAGALSLAESWYLYTKTKQSSTAKRHWTLYSVVDENSCGRRFTAPNPQSALPQMTNYAAIDAWIPGIGAFQMTVGTKQAFNGRAQDDLAMLGGRSNRLYYWLHPPL
jgi:hypothetical protein